MAIATGEISITINSMYVSTGDTQVISVVGGPARVDIKDVNTSTTLLLETVTSGRLSFTVPKEWFDRAGGTTSKSLDVRVTATPLSVSGRPVYGWFTVNAGEDMKPVFGYRSYGPVNTGNAATYFPNSYIAGRTKLTVSIQVTAQTNAQLSQVKLNVAGVENVAMSYNSSTGRWVGTTSAALNENTTWTVTAKDQRGMEASTSPQDVTVAPYTEPVVNINNAGTYRCDSNGDEADDGTWYRAQADAVITTALGLTANGLLEFDVRLQGESQGTALTSGTQSAAINGNMNPALAYTLVFTIQDKVIDTPATFTFELRAPNRDMVIHHSAGGTNVGVGCVPTVSSGLSTVELPAGGKFMIGGVSLLGIIYPVDSIYISDSSTDPGTLFGGTWQPLSSISSHYAWKRTA